MVTERWEELSDIEMWMGDAGSSSSPDCRWEKLTWNKDEQLDTNKHIHVFTYRVNHISEKNQVA